MARAKFEISNERDSINFFNYIRNQEGVLYSELFVWEDYEDNKQRDEECTKYTALYDKIIRDQYRTSIPPETHFRDQTELLYMLPRNRIEKIKTSIRAKRKNKYQKNKKQLTVDGHVHTGLSIYANRYNITLSEAIEKLLKNSRAEIH